MLKSIVEEGWRKTMRWRWGRVIFFINSIGDSDNLGGFYTHSNPKSYNGFLSKHDCKNVLKMSGFISVSFTAGIELMPWIQLVRPGNRPSSILASSLMSLYIHARMACGQRWMSSIAGSSPATGQRLCYTHRPMVRGFVHLITHFSCNLKYKSTLKYTFV